MNAHRKRIVMLNMTSAIPQRILLISKVLGESNEIVQLCWCRTRERNLDGIIEIKAKNFLSFTFILISKMLSLNFDCVVFDDFRLFPVVIPLCKLKRAKILYNRQEIPDVTAAEKINTITKGLFSFSLILKLIKRLERIFCRFVDGIITIPLSNSEMREILSYNKNVAVVKNTPDIMVKPEPFEIAELEGKRYIIYAGNISEQTGLTQYLRLVRKLHETANEDIYLLLIGHLWGIKEDYLRHSIILNKAEEYVIYKSWIPYNKLLSVISKAEIGLALFDPRYEKFKHMGIGSSRKIFTYMSCGIPVISNLPLGALILEEKCGIIVKFEDEEELYRKTLFLLRNKKIRRTLGERGKKAILLKYNWQLESEKIKTVFQNMWLR